MAEAKIDTIKEESVTYQAKVFQLKWECKTIFLTICFLYITIYLLILSLQPLEMIKDKNPDNIYDGLDIQTEDSNRLNQTTHAIVNVSENILNQVRTNLTKIKNFNERIVSQYIKDIRQLIKRRTMYGVKSVSEFILEQTLDIEQELTAYEYNTSQQIDNILHTNKSEIQKIIENVENVESQKKSKRLEEAFNHIDVKLFRMNLELETMFDYQAQELKDFLHKKIQNTTNKIRIILNSEQKISSTIDQQRINFCRNISDQNQDLFEEFRMIVKVINFLTTKTNGFDVLSIQLVHPANEILKNELYSTITFLNSILENDDYFAGSVLKKRAFLEQQLMKNYIIKNFETVIESFIAVFDRAKGFKIIPDNFRSKVQNIFRRYSLILGNELLNKTDSMNANKPEGFQKMKPVPVSIEKQMRKFTETNSVFQVNVQYMIEVLKMNLQKVESEMIPRISTLSIKNYIASDICPMSTDYQQFLRAMMKAYINYKDYFFNSLALNVMNPRDGNLGY